MSPERVLELKAEARRLKEQQGIKQTAALAQVAQREGYRSWEELIARAGGSDVVREVKHEQQWENPTEAKLSRAERRADRLARYGSGS